MLSRRSALITLPGIGLTLAMGLLGCGGNSSIGPGGNTTSQARVFNALVSPITTAVDVAQRSSNLYIAQNVSFGTFSQGGQYSTQVSGNGVNNYVYQTGTTTQVAPQAQYDMSPNVRYTYVVAGDSNQTAGSTYAPKLLQVVDQIPSASDVQGGYMALRIVNVSPSNDPTVYSIDLYNQGLPISDKNNKSITNVTYQGVSYYAILPAASNYNFTLRTHANNNPISLPASTVSQLDNIANNPGGVYTLFLIGEPNSSLQPLNAVIVQDKQY